MTDLDTLKAVSKIKDVNILVSIMILSSQLIDIDTVSEMARKEGKTRRGIETSNKYHKVMIGKQKFAIKGLDENNLPF
jgi:hypothetical protein